MHDRNWGIARSYLSIIFIDILKTFFDLKIIYTNYFTDSNLNIKSKLNSYKTQTNNYFRIFI